MINSRATKAAILSSGTLLTALVSLVSVAILARVLSINEYATYRQTLLVYNFGGPLLSLALPQALYIFLPGATTNARRILSENLTLLFGFAGLFSLFIFLGGNELLAYLMNNPKLSRTLLVLAPYPLFIMPFTAFTSCLMARNRVSTLTIYNIISRIVTLLAVIGVCLLWPHASAVVGANVAISFVVLIPALFLMYSSCSSQEWLPTMVGMWDQLKFSLPLGIASAVSTASSLLDKGIVSFFCSPQQFAVYINGAMELPLVSVVTGSVMAVLLPDMAKSCKEGHRNFALEIWQRAAVKSALIIFPAMFFSLFMARDMVTLLFSAKYIESAIVLQVYLMLLPLRIVYFGPALMAVGRTKIIMVSSLAALLANIIFGIILVKTIGYIGPAIGTILSTYIFQVVIMIYFIAKEYNVSIYDVLPIKILFKIAFLSMASCIVLVPNMFIDSYSSVLRIFIFSIAYAIVIGAAFLSCGLINRNMILSKLEKLRLYITKGVRK